MNALSAQRATAPQAVHDLSAKLTVLGSLPETIKEASGLEITSSGFLWTHNDDRLPILYALDTAGNIRSVIHLNHPNKGWEDLARDENGNLYIGAFGNNDNTSKTLKVYVIQDPENIKDRVYTAGVIDYYYPDQHQFPPPEEEKNFDADAFISLRDSLFIFTKNRTEPFTGYTKIYRLPRTPGQYEALLYDSIYLGNGARMSHWVTAADVSPDKKWLTLLSHDCLWVIPISANKRFSSGQVYKVKLNGYSHKTGLCFYTNTRLYLVDELEFGLIGGRLYSIDLSAVFHRIEKQTVSKSD